MNEIEQNAQTLVALGFEKGREAERKRLVEMIKGLQVDPPTRDNDQDRFAYQLKKGWVWEVRNSLLKAFDNNPV